MLDGQLKKLLPLYMRRWAPSIIRRTEGSSRRIEGAWTTDAEEHVHGYKAVVAYCQRGLGQHVELFDDVLRTVAAFQNNHRLRYLVCLFSFGWDDGKLHHAGKAHEGRWNSVTCGWAQELEELAGMDAPLPDPVVPALFPFVWPQLGVKGRVDREDLLLFFCHDRSVEFTEQVSQRYNRAIQKNSLWFFLGEDPIGIGFGTFQPAVLPAGTD